MTLGASTERFEASEPAMAAPLKRRVEGFAPFPPEDRALRKGRSGRSGALQRGAEPYALLVGDVGWPATGAADVRRRYESCALSSSPRLSRASRGGRSKYDFGK